MAQYPARSTTELLLYAIADKIYFFDRPRLSFLISILVAGI